MSITAPSKYNYFNDFISQRLVFTVLPSRSAIFAAFQTKGTSIDVITITALLYLSNKQLK